jgi:hypothetical protein
MVKYNAQYYDLVTKDFMTNLKFRKEMV